MIPPRWTKILRDLSLSRARTLLALVTLCIGTFSVGTILTAYAVLTREIAVNFQGTYPPSVILHVDGAGADRELARQAEQLAGVSKAEARGLIEGRALLAPDEWRRLLLFVVEDFDRLTVSTFTRDTGSWPPQDGEILIERSAVPFLRKAIGDTLVVQTPKGPRRTLRVVGVVHDPAQSPGWMDGIGYGYITRGTLELLGEGRALNELRVTASANANASEVGQRVRRLAQERGAIVSFVNAAQAARHPHADQMESLLFLFGAFGLLSLLLGGLLAASVIATLLRQQVRQIGAMKSIGATAAQMAGLYAGAVLLLAASALTLGVPLGALAGTSYARFVSAVLNFDLTSRAIPAWVFVVEIGVGLLVPLAAAAVPVVRGSRVTIRQAVSDYGLGDGVFRLGPWDALAARLQWLDRPTLLSLRNTFRRKGRLALTIGIMAAAGATFITAINVSDSWRNTVDSLFTARRYDLQIVFSQPYPAARLQEVIGGVPGVRQVETWDGAWAFRKEVGESTEGYRLALTALPPETKMIAYPILEGRWLRPDDTNAIVINHELRRDPDAQLKVGDIVTLRIHDEPSSWHVVGVVRELGVRRRGQNIPASAYVPRAWFEEVTGIRGMSANLVLSTEPHGERALGELTQRIERALDAAGLQRTIVQPSTHRKRELLDHLLVIRNFLLAMAALVAVVGGLALASAMSVNVMERTREVGVLRAIGASTGSVMRIFAVEGVVLAALSWLLALLVSLPMSRLIGNFAGRVFVHADLDNTFSWQAACGWLGIALLIGLVASMVPVSSASRGPVTKALQYE